MIVPCREHPFGKRMAPWEDRIAMARLAFAPLADGGVMVVHMPDDDRLLPKERVVYLEDGATDGWTVVSSGG